MIIPSLGKHLFSPVEALTSVSTAFPVISHVDLGNFKVPISIDCNGTLHYVSMIVWKLGTLNNSSARTATVESGELRGVGTALAADIIQDMRTEGSTAIFTTVGADVWRKQLGDVT